MEPQRITRKCLERYYMGFMFYDSMVSFVDHDDPTKVELEKDLVKFRFYDQEFIITPEGEKKGNCKNFSPMYFTGKKLNLEEFMSEYGKKYAGSAGFKNIIKTMQENNYPYVCVDENDMVHHMSKDDMTIDDYIKSKQENKTK